MSSTAAQAPTEANDVEHSLPPEEAPLPSPWEEVTSASILAGAERERMVLDAQQLQALDTLARPHARGVYLHGAVGRGKSWMAERALEAAPHPKRRLHIHGFLAELSRLMARERLPLPEAVRALVGDARFLLLDEFHVHDIADAIMLRRTLTTLLESDIALLMTSNYPPEQLLPDPTFHDSVRPAIEAILENLEVVHLGGGHDYRGEGAHARGFASGSWGIATHAPDGEREPSAVAHLSGGTRTLAVHPTPQGVLRVAWAQLCDSPVSVNDYLHLAATHGRWELLGVPAPEQMEPEAFQRLAYLLDVLVDADLPLHITAATDRAAFASAGNLPRDADRMLSRLRMLGEAVASTTGRRG